MNIKLKDTALAMLLILPTSTSLANTTLIFDTITAYKSSPARTISGLSGIQKDTGAHVTAYFGSTAYSSNSSAVSVASVCTPLILTAMEKPGRYYLHVSWDESNPYKQVAYCMLELKLKP